MKLDPINNISSSVYGTKYFPDTKQMYVGFYKTGEYCYEDVSQEEYDTIMAAESIGKGIYSVMKGKKFKKIN